MNDHMEYLKETVKHERFQRNISFLDAVGFTAICGLGIWMLVNGEPFGIVPALAGAGLATGEYYGAADSNSSLQEYKAKVQAYTTRQSIAH